MTQEHPNISLIKRLDPANLGENPDLFAPTFVWHFFNTRLPDVHGDYLGVKGLQTFFQKLSTVTNGTFEVEPISLTTVGDELVVTHVKDRMTLSEASIELDAVVVWRIVDGCIAEAWDIPSLYTESSLVPTEERLHVPS